MRGNCKHGIKGKNCDYDHPTACNKLLQHGNKKPRGCNEGKNCNFFHPRMCANSIKSNKCFNKSCKFIHVKGTLRNENKRHDYAKHPESHNHKNSEFKKEFKSNSDKEMDFLTLIQNLKTEILHTMDMKLAEMNNTKYIMNQPRHLMNNRILLIPNQWQAPNVQISFHQ